MKKFCIIISLALMCAFTSNASAGAKNTATNDFIITDFGAVGDAKTNNTKAIQKAIDTCAEKGGGTVTVPVGTFVTGTIFLRSHVELRLQRGATLLGSLNIPEDYPKRALIFAEGIEDAGISGHGVIDGNSGDPYYQRFRVNDGKRPLGMQFNNCKRISLQDFHLCNAGSWDIRLLGCDVVDIKGISIYSLWQGNNDGIDIDAKNVTISNCRIECDDDGICLKSDLKDFLPENITVTNCVIASNCNPIKLGTSSYSGFKNVTVSNCAVHRTDKSVIWDWSKEYKSLAPGTLTGLAGIAVECVDGGVIENVSFSNIVMEGVITPIFVVLNHRHGNGGVIKNVQFSQITAKADGILPCMISGMKDAPITDIVMRDIIVEHEGGEQPMEGRLRESENGYPENRMFGRENPAGGLYVRHAKNIIVDNFQVTQRNKDFRPAVVLDDVNGFKLSGLQARNTQAKTLVQKIDSKNIVLDPSIAAKPAANRGLDRYDFFYAGERIQHKMYMVQGGKVVWDYFDPDGKGEISDAVLMSDGNILFAHQYGIKEITKDKKVVWSMDTPKGYEIHSIKPIGKNHVVYVQCGNPMTAVVMEIPSKKIVREFPLPFKNGGSHGQNRNICLTSKGTLLVASMEMKTVYEFDSKGKELNAWEVPSAWGVSELKNGNILVTGNNGMVRELNRAGEVVWKYDWTPSDKYPHISTQKAVRLDNGNTILGNWWNEWSGQEVEKDNPPVQFIEITPDGQVVWELSSWNDPADLGPSTTFQLLNSPVDRKKMRFGEFR